MPTEYTGKVSPPRDSSPPSTDQATTPRMATDFPATSSVTVYSSPIWSRVSVRKASPPRLMLMMSTGDVESIVPWPVSTSNRASRLRSSICRENATTKPQTAVGRAA